MKTDDSRSPLEFMTYNLEYYMYPPWLTDESFDIKFKVALKNNENNFYTVIEKQKVSLPLVQFIEKQTLDGEKIFTAQKFLDLDDTIVSYFWYIREVESDEYRSAIHTISIINDLSPGKYVAVLFGLDKNNEHARIGG